MWISLKLTPTTVARNDFHQPYGKVFPLFMRAFLFHSTREDVDDGENSVDDAVGGLLESFNDTPGQFPLFDVLNETSTNSGGNAHQSDIFHNGDDDTTTTEASTSTSTTMDLVLPTESVDTTLITDSPSPPSPPCSVQSLSSSCLISCVNLLDEHLLQEIKRAIEEDFVVSSDKSEILIFSYLITFINRFRLIRL